MIDWPMSENKIPSVGIIGLGIIGSRAAGNLRKAGVDLVLWSRTPRTDPGFVASPVELAGHADVIQIFVDNDQALESVLDQLVPALTDRHCVCCHSTVSPSTVRSACDRVRQAGAGFVEAPFTGSRDAAASGKLAFYVAAADEDLERARPVLEVNAAHMVMLGPEIGRAAVLKIATNMISGTTVCILAEALALVRSCGVNDESLARALEVNGCRSPLTDMKMPAMREQDYSPHFSLANMLKDARLAMDLAQQNGIGASVLAAAAERMERGVGDGRGDSDYAAVFEQFEGADQS